MLKNGKSNYCLFKIGNELNLELEDDNLNKKEIELEEELKVEEDINQLKLFDSN